MRCSFLSATLLALTSFASAQTAGFDAITSPILGQTATAGSTLDIVWQPAGVTGTVSITLLQGSDSTHLQLGPSIATGLDNTLGTFSWAIPSDLASFATYGFKITLDSAPETFQYSFPFQITGTAGSSTSSAASSTGSQTSTTTIKLTVGTSSSTASVTATSSNTTTPISSTTAPSSTASSTPAPALTTSVSNSTLAAVTSTATSNASSTLSKNISTSTVTKASGSSSGGASSTASPTLTGSANAVIGRAATGSLALVGGIMLAFAL